MKTIINTPKAPAPIGPYNQAILSDSKLYISGQIPINPETGDLETSSIEQETKQVMLNIKAILEAAEMSFDNVIKCSIFVSDLANFSSINTIYGSYFDEATAPARETVQVAALPKQVNVEISAIAVK